MSHGKTIFRGGYYYSIVLFRVWTSHKAAFLTHSLKFDQFYYRGMVRKPRVYSTIHEVLSSARREKVNNITSYIIYTRVLWDGCSYYRSLYTAFAVSPRKYYVYERGEIRLRKQDESDDGCTPRRRFIFPNGYTRRALTVPLLLPSRTVYFLESPENAGVVRWKRPSYILFSRRTRANAADRRWDELRPGHEQTAACPTRLPIHARIRFPPCWPVVNNPYPRLRVADGFLRTKTLSGLRRSKIFRARVHILLLLCIHIISACAIFFLFIFFPPDAAIGVLLYYSVTAVYLIEK